MARNCKLHIVLSTEASSAEKRCAPVSRLACQSALHRDKPGGGSECKSALNLQFTICNLQFAISPAVALLEEQP